MLAAGPVLAVVNRLTRRHPRMAFQVATGVASAIYRGLMERTIEVAITRVSGPVDEEVLRVETLFDDVLVVAAGARNPWTRRRRIALADLVNERWVLPLPDSLTTALAMEAFRASGLELPRATVVTPSLSMRNRLLTTGGFLTAIHGFALAVPGTSPMIRPLPVAMPNSRRPIALITLKKRALSPLAEYFMDNMRAIAKAFAKGEAASGKARHI